MPIRGLVFKNTVVGGGGGIQDVTPPALSSGEVGAVADNKIVLTYTEPLDPASVPATGDFAIAGSGLPATISSVAVSGSTVTLTLSSDIYDFELLKVSYTAGTNKIRDLNMNNAANLSAQLITNNGNGSCTLNGQTLDYTDLGLSAAQVDAHIAGLKTCTNSTIDISGSNAHRTSGSNSDLNTLIANGNTITLNDVLGAELHTSLNAANDSATEAITAFADYSATIDGGVQVTQGQDISDMLPLGSELITNGDFANWTGDDPDDWTVGNEDVNNYATEDAGKCQIVSDNSAAVQIGQTVLTVGKYYILSIDVKANTGSGITIGFNGGNEIVAGLTTVADNQEYIFRATNTQLSIKRGGVTDTTFDNVSVKEIEVLGSDLVTNGTFASDSNWTKGTGWSIAAGVASCDGSQTAESGLYQAPISNMNDGASHLYKITVSNYSAGNLRFKIYNAPSVYSSNISANGTYTVLAPATNYNWIYLAADANFVGDIDNVSVHKLLVTKEIAASTNYSGSHYVIPESGSDLDSFVIPASYSAESIVAQVITGESNLTTGWTAANNAVLSSVSTPVNQGEFALSIESNTTPTASADSDISITVENAAVYRLSVDHRHCGTGDDWILDVEGSTVDTLDNTETTYATKVYYFTAGDTTCTITYKENNASNDGGVFADNLSLKKVTLT